MRVLSRAVLVALALVFIPATLPAQQATQSPWVHEDTADGIAIYTSELSDHDFDAVKGIVTLPIPATPLFMALYRFEEYPSWYYDCADVRVLASPPTHPEIPVLGDGKFGKFEAGGPWMLYFRQRTPPLDDRWAILRCTYHEGPGNTLIVKFRSVEPYAYKAPEGLVRMHLHGSWMVKPIDKSHTQVAFELAVDPRTRVPAFIVNRRLHETVFETLKGLARTARK